MDPLYVIVHQEVIWDEQRRLLAEEKGLGRIPSILVELCRIRLFERYVEIEDNPSHIFYPLEEHILVCGGYGELCVAEHILALKQRGVLAHCYRPATLFSADFGVKIDF